MAFVTCVCSVDYDENGGAKAGLFQDTCRSKGVDHSSSGFATIAYRTPWRMPAFFGELVAKLRPAGAKPDLSGQYREASACSAKETRGLGKISILRKVQCPWSPIGHSSLRSPIRQNSSTDGSGFFMRSVASRKRPLRYLRKMAGAGELRKEVPQ